LFGIISAGQDQHTTVLVATSAGDTGGAGIASMDFFLGVESVDGDAFLYQRKK